MKITFIGDIHGRPQDVLPVSGDCIQVGDMGIGFDDSGKLETWLGQNPGVRFIRGNHDNPALCRAHPRYMGDYGVWKGVFFLGGANSIDAHLRTPGLDWWPDEQLSQDELTQAVDHYKVVRPQIVVSHDCPHRVKQTMFGKMFEGEKFRPTPTSLAMGEMLKFHQPKMWIFGHWHQNKVMAGFRTAFVCLGIGSAFTVEVNA